MSIQAAREKLAGSHSVLIQADDKFFRGAFERLDKFQNGKGHMADLRRLHNDVAKWLNSHATKDDYESLKDAPAYEGALAFLKVCDCDLQNRAYALEGAAAMRPETSSGWKDAATGEPIRLYAPDERINNGSEIYGREVYGAPVTVGAVLNGLLNGPKTDAVRNALSEGVDSAGGFSVPKKVLEQFIDNLRAKTQFIRAGARTLVLDTMQTSIVRVTSDAMASWRQENAAVATGQPAFDNITFVPKSLAVLVPISLELLQDSINIDAILERTLSAALAVALDQAALFGDGTENNPVGLYHTTGINTLTLGTNGAELTSYDNFIDAVYEIEAANAGPPTAAIMNPRTMQSLRKMKDSQGRYLEPPSSLSDLKMLGTTSVPINQTQGTATDATTALVGDYTQAILGIRQELRIQRLNEAMMGNLQVGFLAHLRADVGFAHPQSFTAIEGIIP